MPKVFDYWRGAWFMYQNLMVAFIEATLKWKYKLTLGNEVKEDYKSFRNSIKKFKQAILHKNYDEEDRLYDIKTINNTRDKDLDILLEWDGNCFEDINLLKILTNQTNDLHVFIQVKTKTENSWNISVWDGILKSIYNFQKNINFQKYKNDSSIIFFIITNKNISKTVNDLVSKKLDSYIQIIDHIITKNNSLVNKDILLPTKELNKFNWAKNKEFIESILNWYSNISDFWYNWEELGKFINLVRDIEKILSNIHIIHSIKTDILENELENYYWKDLWNKIFEIQKKSWDVTPIQNVDGLYENYMKYEHTFFDSKDWWKYAFELDEIKKWKFL